MLYAFEIPYIEYNILNHDTTVDSFQKSDNQFENWCFMPDVFFSLLSIQKGGATRPDFSSP